MTEKNGEAPRDILNIDEAAELLGVSLKTFNKVLHSEDMPARKIGREWKFSRKALIEWVGSGRSRDRNPDCVRCPPTRSTRGARTSTRGRSCAPASSRSGALC